MTNFDDIYFGGPKTDAGDGPRPTESSLLRRFAFALSAEESVLDHVAVRAVDEHEPAAASLLGESGRLQQAARGVVEVVGPRTHGGASYARNRPTAIPSLGPYLSGVNVTQSLKHIDRAVADVLETREEYDDASRGSSRRGAYERSIEAVREEADPAAAKRLARWIEDRIREEEALPSGQRVREKAAELCREPDRRVSAKD